MNIKTTAGPSSAIRAKTAATAAAPQQEESKPSAVDSFSQGATKGANMVNTAFGVWHGGASGLIAGAAIGAGTEIIGAITGAVTGSGDLGLGTIIDTALSAGMWAAGGAVVGGAVGGVITNQVGKFTGNIGAKAATKFKGNENVGRAVGTLAPAVVLGTVAGAGIAGINGATLALGVGAAGGALAYLNS